jgi:hypothetical protein
MAKAASWTGARLRPRKESGWSYTTPRSLRWIILRARSRLIALAAIAKADGRKEPW